MGGHKSHVISPPRSNLNSPLGDCPRKRATASVSRRLVAGCWRSAAATFMQSSAAKAARTQDSCARTSAVRWPRYLGPS
jgi:hypothetical protein